MTMPHLMNCGHSASGWCLECVGELYAEKIEIQKRWNESVKLLDKKHDQQELTLTEPERQILEKVLTQLAEEEGEDVLGLFMKRGAFRTLGEAQMVMLVRKLLTQQH